MQVNIILILTFRKINEIKMSKTKFLNEVTFSEQKD